MNWEFTSIRSRSPQARGRVERLWGTFQDRLVSELRLASVSTLEKANQFLQAYLPKHNRNFAVPARQPGLAYRSARADAEECFCFKYIRTVGLDNVLRIGPHRLQVLPGNGKSSFARLKVEVRQTFDGTLSVFKDGQKLKTAEAVPEATLLRNPVPPQIAARPRVYSKPAPDHPWRGKYRIFIDK